MTKNHNAAVDVEVVVIGAGLTGIYQVHLLDKTGISVRGIEAGENVGGTWYWNRYPGCRLDTESYAYGYFALKGILPDWEWSEYFAGQPELLRYANAAADAMDVRKHFTFNTRVNSANYREDGNFWEVGLDNGEITTCRFLVSAAGPLSATRMPDYPGIESFEGQAYHSSRWPVGPDGGPADIDFTGKRVGVIGTGATGVQIVPNVAKTAKELYVFQRTPNWCTPLGNEPLPPEEMDAIRKRFGSILEYIKTTPTAFPYHRDPRKGTEVAAAERNALFERLYDARGYGIWLSGFRDILLDKRSNDYLAEFVGDKIRQRVNDPAVAEKLIPKDHPFGAKRVPMETNYYEAYNQPNVHLVDIREAPIQRFTPTGIVTADETVELDVIIFATGFDAVTGAIDRIDITGKNGERLRDTWADGPITYLGLQTRDFPNFFTLVGPHNGSAFCNIGVCGSLQVEWMTRMIEYMRDNGLSYAEPEQAAQEEWTEFVYKDFARTLMADADAWWVKTTIKPDGTKVRRALAYVGGGPQYRQRCEEIAFNGYEGFEMA